MNIVDVLSSLPPTKLDLFTTRSVHALPTVFMPIFVIIASYVIYSVGDCSKQLKQVLLICGKHGRSAVIPVLLQLSII